LPCGYDASSGQLKLNRVIDNLSALLPTSKAMWLLLNAGLITLAFALSAFACDRLGHKIIGPFLAAGAWLSAAFCALVWFWQTELIGRLKPSPT
jgi:hypothetical protein